MINAALSSAAGQEAAVLAGEQEKFDWKAVGIAALSAWVASPNGVALNTFGAGYPVANAIVDGAVSNALTQKVSVIAHLQDRFDWKSVAAAAAAASAGVARSVAGADFGSGKIAEFARDATTRFAGGVAAAVVRGGHVAVMWRLRS